MSSASKASDSSDLDFLHADSVASLSSSLFCALGIIEASPPKQIQRATMWLYVLLALDSMSDAYMAYVK